MRVHLPSFLGHGRDASGADAAVAVVLRAAGVTVLAVMAFGVLLVGQGIWVVSGLAGDKAGWEGLIAAVALGLGLLMLLGGGGVAWGLHMAFAGWRDGRPRPVAVTGWVFVVVGATAPLPVVFQEYPTPLDQYLLVARLVLLAIGIALVAWARSAASARAPDAA